MNKTLIWTTQFAKDMERMAKQKKKMHILFKILKTIENGNKIPISYKPHHLKGKWKNYMECHIQPDWLLIWKEDKKKYISDQDRISF